jgi:uncharacterized membrane protein YoaK (UPF0700 family)
MLIREGTDRTVAIDLKLASSLAGIAGALNAAGFQAAGFFSANMTGNVSSLSDYLGLANFGLAGIFAALVLTFIGGAFCSGLLIEAGRSREIRGIYAYSILLEAALLLSLAVADISLPAIQSGPPLVLGLSFIMGLQNAATTRISNAKVRTTHVSGMATDIGLNLAALWSARCNQPEASERLRLHFSTLAAFLLGGVVGAVSYVLIGGLVLALCAIILMLIALPELKRARGRS